MPDVVGRLLTGLTFWLSLLALAAVATNTARASSVFVDPTSVIHLTPKNFNPASQNKSILDSIATPDGIFAAGWPNHERDHVWAFKVSRDGSLAWASSYETKKLEDPQVARTALDGGYWVAGVAYTRDVGNVHGLKWMAAYKSAQYEYIRRFDHNGKVSDLMRISPIGDNHFFECGMELPGGYLLTGWSPTGSPWIEMIDNAGKKLWERSFIEQQDRLLEKDLGLGINHCGGLHVSADGIITWVTTVRTNYIINTPQGRRVVRRKNSSGFWGIFLVQLDASGKDIRRSFRPDVLQPTLLPNGDGFLLFLHPRHQDQHPPPSALLPDALGYQPGVDLGLSAEFLDASLAEIRSWSFKPDDRASAVVTAFQTPEGGWLLATCDGADGLKYLNSKGVLSDRVSIDFDKSNDCDRITIAEGPGAGEALVVAFNERAGVRAMIAKYTD